MSRIVFFASLRETTGMAELAVDLTGQTSLADLMTLLKERLSATAYAAITAENVRIALNQEFVHADALFSPGDEIAFLPPVTGG